MSFFFSGVGRHLCFALPEAGPERTIIASGKQILHLYRFRCTDEGALINYSELYAPGRSVAVAAPNNNQQHQQ